MALINSISGIRGTIGGLVQQNLTPSDVVAFTSAFVFVAQHHSKRKDIKIVVGRDGRISGAIISQLVINTVLAMGANVINIDYATTPTVGIAVKNEGANGGIMLSASHNPKEWNALKLFNAHGEFIDATYSGQMNNLLQSKQIEYAEIEHLGKILKPKIASYVDFHIDKIIQHQWVNIKKIKSKKLTIVVDTIQSVGILFIPKLLKQLGVAKIICINDDLSGNFKHNPEPLEEHLIDLKAAVKKHKADLGIAVDPDVDRVCFITEKGTMFGEEYSLVAIADYVLAKQKGVVINNLSSSQALIDIANKYHQKVYSSMVGEAHVVNAIKHYGAVMGGEGNGGIIIPDHHYGRDALIGIALMLSHLTESNITMSALRKKYPNYIMLKHKINFNNSKAFSLNEMETKLKQMFPQAYIDKQDGLKIILPNEWIQIRKSNTENIVRIYTESATLQSAQQLVEKIKKVL